MSLPSAASTHKTGYKGYIKVSVAATNSYGEAQSVVSPITYVNVEEIMLPKPKYGSTKVQTLAGLVVVPEGATDYGQVTFKLPEDAGDAFSATTTTPGTPVEYTLEIGVPALAKKFTVRAHVVDEGGAGLKRGQAFSRDVTLDAHELVTPAAI